MQELGTQRHKRIVVVGVGNDFRHDDAAGLIAARRLRDCGIPAEEHQGDFATLIERWKDADSLILIDAIAPGRVPGAIHGLNASTSPLDRQVCNASTHAFGLADVIELSQHARHTTLTLVTCYPFYYVGPAPKRFIVHAALSSAGN